jgi:hypothetical protein
MSNSHDASDRDRREFLKGAAVITAGYFVIGKRPDSVDFLFQTPGPHVMTFDVTQTPMTCTFSPPQSGTDCTLTVTGNDVVHFKAKTSQSKHHLSVLFVDGTPFLDSSTPPNKVWAFHGSESDEGSGIGKNAHIDPSLPDGATFEFLVGVWDGEDSNQKSYTSDPTIIIGKGGSSLVTAIAQLSAADRLLQKAAALQTTESENISKVEAQVALIIGRLRTQLQKPAK